MPALVNSSVGSFAGSSGLERTRVCPCRSKYCKNFSRISLPVIISEVSLACVVNSAEGAKCNKPGPAGRVRGVGERRSAEGAKYDLCENSLPNPLTPGTHICRAFSAPNQISPSDLGRWPGYYI